ncbi:hypothetical protein R1T15_14080 [Mucilaginibacter sp. L3T2-6]|nr:hypothetical protein [Mucilaginibacter sp. L3T2-6]
MRQILQTPTPKALYILVIIFLGGCGMIVTKQLLVRDIRLSGFNKEYIAVQNTDVLAGPGKTEVVDTLVVTHHGVAKANAVKLGNIKTTGNMPYKSLFFEYNSVFLVWMSLISIMIGISLALAPVIIKSIKDLVRIFSIPGAAVWQSIAAVLLLGGALVYAQQNSYMLQAFDIMDRFKILLYHPGALNIVVLTSLGVGLIAITGKLIINYAVGKLPERITGMSETEQKKVGEKFLLLRNQLKFFLLVDAILIVFSILTTDALRRSILTEVTFSIDIFPDNFVYLYGLLFTFFLGLLYMPIYYRLRYKGATMLHDIPQAELDGDKKTLSAIFLIQETPMQSLQVSLAILAPVLTSLAPNVLKI